MNTDFFDIESEVSEANKLTPKEAFARVSGKLAEKNEEAQELLVKKEALEFEISKINDRYRELTENEMPSLMDEIGVSSITLNNGQTVRIDSSLHCGIPASRKEEAHEWLRQNGHGDIIKNEINIKFGKSEDNMVGEIQEVAERLGLKFDRKEAVHAMTLKAFTKEQMRQGAQLPLDLFGVFIKRVVNLKG